MLVLLFEAVDLALRASLIPETRYFITNRATVSYHPGAILAHGQPIAVPTQSDEGFALNPAALAEAWEPGCKVLMLNFPTNPTGGTASRVLRQIAKFACDKDLIVLSDEIYSELTFDGTHTSVATFSGMKERTIFLRLFQSLFHDGIPHRLCLRSGDLIEAMMKVPNTA